MSAVDTAGARAAIVHVARRMRAERLVIGTSGNVSARGGRGFLVTPSAVPFDTLTEDALVEMTLGGEVIGPGRPSSEWRIHRDVYVDRPDVHGVVHAHPEASTAVSCLRWEIPALHYMVAVAGGDTIRCAAYATFGTEALSRNVLVALEGRLACLMANHGLLAVGDSVDRALDVAMEVELLAAVLLRVRTVGAPALLSTDEMAEVVARFADYKPR